MAEVEGLTTKTAFSIIAKRYESEGVYTAAEFRSFRNAFLSTDGAMRLARVNAEVASAPTFIGNFILVFAISLAVLILLEPKDIGAYIVNDSNEDFVNGIVYLKRGRIVKAPPPTLSRRKTIGYLKGKQMFYGTGVSVALFRASKSDVSFVGTEGAVSYQSRDGDKKIIFA